MATASRLAARIETLEKASRPHGAAVPVIVLHRRDPKNPGGSVFGYRVSRWNFKVDVLRTKTESDDECRERAIAAGKRCSENPLHAIVLTELLGESRARER